MTVELTIYVPTCGALQQPSIFSSRHLWHMTNFAPKLPFEFLDDIRILRGGREGLTYLIHKTTF